MEARFRVEFDTPLAPERVLAALTDFSEARPRIWPALDPRKYQVDELGPGWALATEGNRRPDIWARERYDWSKRGSVSWRTEESNAFAPGSQTDARVAAGPGGGSHVAMQAVRIPASRIGYVMVAVLRLFGKRFFLSNYKGTFDRLAREA